MATQPADAIEVFYSYSHKDEELRDQLENHLAMLKREGVIQGWHDRRISAGQEWDGEIDAHLKSADIILLLVSSDFLASNYCYDIEVTLAMERHEAKAARVIPVILRPCDWTSAPFGKLQGLPKDVTPVRKWSDQDEAFLDIAKGIRRAAGEIRTAKEKVAQPDTSSPTNSAKPAARVVIPRPPAVGFVARRDAKGRDIVELLRAELAPERNQLVVLWGAGGVGKTALAVEAAGALSGVFGRRIVWSSPELRADLTLSTLLDEIATQLGRADLGKLAFEAKEEAVRDLLAEAHALVILDNFETINSDEQARCAKWLAQRASCPALITTRQRVAGAHNISINAMSPEEAREFVERWIKREAHNSRAFEGLERDRVIETAGRNPLCLGWVLARIDLAGEPGEVLAELTEGEGDAAQRIFDGSFNLPQLGDDGRDALLALSLFVPDASRDALAEAAGFGRDGRKRLNEAVMRLSSLWLLETTAGNKRLKIEGLTRELAKHRLSKDARDAEFRRRFVGYFRSYTEAHAQPSPENYDALEAEKDNAASAIDMAFEMQDWESIQTIASVVAAPVTGVLSVRGYWDEAKRCNKQGLATARALASEKAIAFFTHNVAVLHQNQGGVEEARRLYGESLEIKERLGDQRGIAGTLHHLAMLAQAQGEIEEARRLYDESLEIAKRLGNQSGIANTLHQLGWLAQGQREIEEARRLYGESLEIKKRLGDQSGIAGTLHQLGRLAEVENDKGEAARLYREALGIFEKLKSPNAEIARRSLARALGESS